MELTLFGIGLILMIFTWPYIWRPTVLDSARDKLFDLRDNKVRQHFLQRGLGLDHPVYVALRNLLNGHLRHTESLTFFHFTYLAGWAESHRAEEVGIRQKIDAMFATEDPDLQRLVKSVREQSSLIMIEYMVESSIVALSMAIVVAIWMAIKSVFVTLRRVLFGNGPVSGIALARLAMALLSLASSLGVMTRSNAQATMEECALHKRA